MYGADRVCLPLPQAAAVAAAAAGVVDNAPAAEDSDSNSEADSIIGDAESSSERAERGELRSESLSKSTLPKSCKLYKINL